MTTKIRPRGRPGKYAPYEDLLAGLPSVMTKRPKYLNGIGLFKGGRSITAWLKIRLPHGATYDGKAYEAGGSLEIKVGNLSSWKWEQLEALKTELQGKADRNEPLQEAPLIRFEAFANEWLERAKTRVRDWSTLKIHVNNSLNPFFGKKDLKTITVGDINSWQNQQLKKLKPGSKNKQLTENQTLTPGYVKRQFNTLRAILNDAVKSGWIDKNPCSAAEPIKGMAARQHFLTKEQSHQLIKEAARLDEWLADYLSWLLHSGMRPGEPLSLKWSQLLERPDGKPFIIVEATKSGKPRPVTCTKTMVEILGRQRARKKANDDRIFPIAESTLKRKVNKLREIDGFADFRLHDLRRTNMTHLVSEGVDLRTLQGRVGHSDLSMMQKHYAVYLGDDDAAEKAEAIFGQDNAAGTK